MNELCILHVICAVGLHYCSETHSKPQLVDRFLPHGKCDLSIFSKKELQRFKMNLHFLQSLKRLSAGNSQVKSDSAFDLWRSFFMKNYYVTFFVGKKHFSQCSSVVH